MRTIQNRRLVMPHLLGSSCGGTDAVRDTGSALCSFKLNGGIAGETSVEPPPVAVDGDKGLL